MAIRKELNQRFQEYFTEDLSHDWLINLLAAEQKGMYFYNESLFLYRIHGKNTIGINEQEHYTKKEQRLSQYQPDYKKRMMFY